MNIEKGQMDKSELNKVQAQIKDLQEKERNLQKKIQENCKHHFILDERKHFKACYDGEGETMYTYKCTECNYEKTTWI